MGHAFILKSQTSSRKIKHRYSDLIGAEEEFIFHNQAGMFLGEQSLHAQSDTAFPTIPNLEWPWVWAELAQAVLSAGWGVGGETGYTGRRPRGTRAVHPGRARTQTPSTFALFSTDPTSCGCGIVSHSLGSRNLNDSFEFVFPPFKLHFKWELPYLIQQHLS